MADLSQISGTRKLLAAIIAVLAFLALALSTYLTWVTWQQSTVAGCTGASAAGCDEVLSSAGSKWLGIPVSLFGALTYAAILALVWPGMLVGGWAMTVLLALAMLAAGAGVWFIGMQTLVVQHFCLYCLAIHTCGFLICAATVFLMRTSASEPNYDHMRAYFGAGDVTADDDLPSELYRPLIAAGAASAGLLVLILGQMMYAPSGMQVVEDVPLKVVEKPVPTTEQTPVADNANTDEEPVEPSDEPVVVSDEDDGPAGTESAELKPGKLEVVNGEPDENEESTFDSLFSDDSGAAQRYFRLKYLQREVDAAGNPVVGNPYAQRRLVEMMDYTCPHCRKLHPFIKQAVERYGDQLGFVIYHVPLSRKCNPLVKVEQPSHRNACEYAELAYGVWKLAPQKFVEYHYWLLEGEKPPSIYDAKKKAMALAGEAVLTDKSIEVESSRRAADNAADLEPLQVGLPALIFDEGIVRGMPDSEKEWFQMLEERMGLKPLTPAAN